MFVRPYPLLALFGSLLLLGAGAAGAPARLVVENDTYSSLVVAVVDAAGREVTLGQAPPDFVNTLLVSETLAAGRVHFHARLVGETQILYRSEPVRLVSGAKMRWRLPANVIES